MSTAFGNSTGHNRMSASRRSSRQGSKRLAQPQDGKGGVPLTVSHASSTSRGADGGRPVKGPTVARKSDRTPLTSTQGRARSQSAGNSSAHAETRAESGSVNADGGNQGGEEDVSSRPSTANTLARVQSTTTLSQQLIQSCLPGAAGSIASITMLSLSNQRLGNLKALQTCASLQTVDVSCNCLASLEGIQNNKKLVEVRAQCNRLKNVAALSQLAKLETVLLHINELGKDVKGQKGVLAGLRKLRSVRADCNFLEDLAIFFGQSGHGSLQSLDVSQNPLVTMAGLSFPNLMDLTAQHCRLQSLGTMQRTMPKLQYLHLDGTRMSSKALATSAMGVSSLAVVTLRGCANLGALEPLAQFGGITELRLAGVSCKQNAEDSYVPSLAAVLPSWGSLQVLDVSSIEGIEYTSAVKKLFETHCPDLFELMIDVKEDVSPPSLPSLQSFNGMDLTVPNENETRRRSSASLADVADSMTVQDVEKEIEGIWADAMAGTDEPPSMLDKSKRLEAGSGGDKPKSLSYGDNQLLPLEDVGAQIFDLRQRLQKAKVEVAALGTGGRGREDPTTQSVSGVQSAKARQGLITEANPAEILAVSDDEADDCEQSSGLGASLMPSSSSSRRLAAARLYGSKVSQAMGEQ